MTRREKYPSIALADKRYQEKKRLLNPGMKTAEARVYYSKYPEKVAAHRKVRRALRDGKLTKTPCVVCGVSNVYGHHPDYSKPLDVIWLCASHHQKAHI